MSRHLIGCIVLFSSLLVSGCDQLQTATQKASTAAGLDATPAKTQTNSQSADKFEMKEDKAGRTIRLNKATGEIAVLDGNALVPVQTPEDAEKYAGWISYLSTAKTWTAIELPQISKDTKLELTTSWRDGKLYYRFMVSASQKMRSVIAEQPGGYFNIFLTDAGGFNLVRARVQLRTLSRIINSDGKLAGFEMNDSIACSEKVYVGVVSWNVQWYF